MSDFQKDIGGVLRQERGAMLFSELRERFPRQARTRSLHRSVQSMKRRGLVRTVEVNGKRWIVACRAEADKELLALSRQAIWQLETLAKARGLPPEAVEDILRGEDVDRYRHHIFQGE